MNPDGGAPSDEAIGAAVREALPQASAAWLFGSAAQDHFRPGSDLDIAVDLPQPLDAMQKWAAAEQIAQQFRIDVDLLDFHRLSTVMQFQVLATGRLLFSQDARATLEYTAFVMGEYQRIQVWRQPMMRQLAERLVHGGASS